MKLSTNIKFKIIKSDFITDTEGCVEIPRNRGVFLLNAVKVIQPSAAVVNETAAVWESLWASTTYSTD